ncbi:MAG: peptidylprolyl isomerase [Acidobacteriota bacterium]
MKASFAQTSNVSASTLRVVVDTTLGAFTVELDRAAAPETVRRFLARSYDGLQLCEARAHGYLVFGCAPFRLDGPKGDAPHRESPLLEEIDGIAMGLDRQPIDVPQPIEWLWQQEVFPLYLQLRDKGRPIPAGLETLIEAARTKGTAAIEQLKGKSRLWYLTQLGHRFTEGRSAARFSRGAVGVAAFWPGAGDERFVIALTDLPERDGRATVFGRIVDGWDTLDRIEMLPVDKSHRTLTAVFLNAVRIEGSAPGEGSGSNKEPTR